jgi:hypothetical protein
MNEENSYYQSLRAVNQQIAKDFSDAGGEGGPRIELTAPEYVDSNFPWLYIKFDLEGPLSLHALKQIEKRYQAFVAVEGGALETIYLNRRGPGFVVKLVYVPGKKKAPAETQELPDSDSGA